MFFGRFYLDREKDLIVTMEKEGDRLFYVLTTPNHHSGNLITNLAELCGLPLSRDDAGLCVIRGEIPCYVTSGNEEIYIFRLGGTKVANIYPDGRVEMKASVPAISKILMSQTKNYRLDISRTIIKTYIPLACKFRTDLHTHMNANLAPDILIALGIFHQIRYPLYYIKKLGLRLTKAQELLLNTRREKTAVSYAGTALLGKYLERKIDDNTFINFADLILADPGNAAFNIPRIRASLAVLKDGQAVFSNLEKVYLYRYVFTKGQPAEDPVSLDKADSIPDAEIASALGQMIADHADGCFKDNTLFQDKLLWTARGYERQGVRYAEISDTTLVKRDGAAVMLEQVHRVMPAIREETGVMLRFLAGIRRIPLTIVKDNATPAGYLTENLAVLAAVAQDPYVAGCDILGEEINDIRDISPVIRQITAIAAKHPSFVIRIHAGENDSLRDNVANSIRCVAEALAPGQPMPALRIGHGLYTSNLRSPAGRNLLQSIIRSRAVLEFQISSNVRLNNLSSVEKHPLREYLAAGVRCVQGTDGGALYGTDTMDEELSLMKLLGVTETELLDMRRTEDEIMQASEKAFLDKLEQLLRSVKIREGGEDEGSKGSRSSKSTPKLPVKAESGSPCTPPCGDAAETLEEGTVFGYYHSAIEKEVSEAQLLSLHHRTVSSPVLFDGCIRPIPRELTPVIIAGGSFNNDRHRTVLREECVHLIDALLRRGDPGKFCFVIGNSFHAYERYLIRANDGRFQIFAFVPSEAEPGSLEALRRFSYPPAVRVGIESTRAGLYKSIAYETFKQRPSVLLTLDGNSAAVNLMQEAKNAKNKCLIYANPHARMLAAKARSLSGYVRMLTDGGRAAEEVLDWIAHL